MRHLYILFCFTFLFNNFIIGQNQKYVLLSDKELGLINDLSSTFKDTSIVISPFIVSSIDSSSIDMSKLTKKFNFVKSQFGNHANDTLLLRDNIYFKIIRSDSLLKYEKLRFDVDYRIHEKIDLFQTPILYYVEKNYKKNGICYFYKPVFSRDKTSAVVKYWVDCGSLCGWGETVLMKKTKEKWIIIDTFAYEES